MPGYKVRLRAARRAAGLSLTNPIGVYCFPEAIDLRDSVQIGRFIRFVEEADPKLVRVTFDTFAASTPSASENNSEDMTAAIAGAQKVIAAFDATSRSFITAML